jgi:glycosyltransferase involved in cell wall biosynthesis
MIKKTEKEIIEQWGSSDKPLVSMCCITFNHEQFIEQALDSMLIQETSFPFEIIIRDDCSTDKTRDIVKKYSEKFPHIIKTILETENQYSKGVNPFIPTYERARGKYVTILEGDDYWRDNLKLQKQVDFLEKNNAYILSYHNSIIVDENDELISEMKNTSPADYTQEAMLCGEVLILTNTVMFRKVNNVTAEQLDGILNADTVLWHLLGHYGKSKYQEEIVYAAYRIHSGGVWSKLDEFAQFEKSLQISKHIRCLLKNNTKLNKKMIYKIHYHFSNGLYKSFISGNFRLFQNIMGELNENKNISKIKVFILIPKVFLKKIKSEYMR